MSLLRLLRRGLTLALVAPLAWPLGPLTEHTVRAVAQDVGSVREEVEELEERVSSSAAAYEDVWGQAEQARAELDALERRTAALEEEAAAVSALLVRRARRVFMHGSDNMIMMLMTAEGPKAVADRANLIMMLTSRERTRLESVRNIRTQLRQARVLQADKAAELHRLQSEMDQHLATLEDDLEGARALLGDLEEREARKREIRRGPQQGVYACIFDRPFNFRDTWGAPRSGGRRHKGTDVFSYHGAPVYSFTEGRIQRISNSRLGGLGLYLFGADGNLYYYAHLDRVADGVQVGQYVEAGELVAHNGDSGNARGGAPHVHYQMHPGGGAPVNPYPWLAAACY